MRASIVPAGAQTVSLAKLSNFFRLARSTVWTLLLRGFERGQLTLVEGDEHYTFTGRSGDTSLKATITVRDPRFYRGVLFGGSSGAGAAYMNGFWSCDDLTTLVRIILLNAAMLDTMDRGVARLAEPLQRFWHFLRRNTRIGSRRNITAHYDLGNDFFALFLDETLTYSCAIFEREESTLREASVAKLDRICRKLELSAGDHLLEIGTGWGSFAIHAAQHYGCHVTTTTVSQQQHELACQRVAEAGVTGQVSVLLKDYRDLTGQYDKLVSIEMIEAVGHAFYDTYLRRCSELLKPDGVMLLQAIVIADQWYERAKSSVDFIQRYIFPGSCIPSITAICTSLTRATNLRLFHLEDLTPHYAITLRRWRERLFANADRVRALGYPESFMRMWEFYLCYCEGGFLERSIGDVQMVLTKPRCRRASILPPLS
jgi:cyclopropane-fatty-acyl-phospholipid synthase